MVTLAHKFLEEVLSYGDTAVDLTAGGGWDTLFLAERTGVRGRVFAFDIQSAAIARTHSLLAAKGVNAVSLRGTEAGLTDGGVFLVNDDHQKIRSYVQEKVQGAIANLGYLPGGDKSILTGAETTLSCLRDTLSLLAPGGRMAVIAYVGHGGGPREAEAVSSFFEELPSTRWGTMKVAMMNRKAAPILLIAEKV